MLQIMLDCQCQCYGTLIRGTITPGLDFQGAAVSVMGASSFCNISLAICVGAERSLSACFCCLQGTD